MKLSYTNKTRLLSVASLLVLALLHAQTAFAQTRTIMVQVNKPGAKIPKTLFGLFFEDINFDAGGGLYPERIQLPVSVDGSAKNGLNDLYTSASVDEQSGQVILKVVNTGSASSEVRITLAGAAGTGTMVTTFVLQSSDLKAENSLDQPTKIGPVERQFSNAGGEFVYTFMPHSFTVLRIPSR
jgi:alpha-L-arabinofuranosidase